MLADRFGELSGWDDVKLLTVTVDRLKRWYRPGLLAIGDAAHAMSPVGGVGINLAIQDAVATANLLAAPLARGETVDGLLARVQARRMLPTRVIQGTAARDTDADHRSAAGGRPPATRAPSTRRGSCVCSPASRGCSASPPGWWVWASGASISAHPRRATGDVGIAGANLALSSVMVGIEACRCEGRGPTIHEFACTGSGARSDFPITTRPFSP